MFIACHKNLLVREGTEQLSIPTGFIGQIDDRWAKHWFIQAAMQDGTIETADEKTAPAQPETADEKKSK